MEVSRTEYDRLVQRVDKLERELNQHRFSRSTRGVTLVEYGLIAALIAIAVVVALESTGTGLNDLFTSISTAV